MLPCLLKQMILHAHIKAVINSWMDSVSMKYIVIGKLSDDKQAYDDSKGQHDMHENVYHSSLKPVDVKQKDTRNGVTRTSTTSPNTGISSSKWQRTTTAFWYTEPSVCTLRTLLINIKQKDVSYELCKLTNEVFVIVHVNTWGQSSLLSVPQLQQAPPHSLEVTSLQQGFLKQRQELIYR